MDFDQVERYLREIRRTRIDIVERVQRVLQDPATERGLRDAGRVLRETGPALLRDVLSASKDFADAFVDAMPENFHALTNPQVFAAVELMEGTGWSLLWTPPAETVVELLGTRDAAVRREILLGAEPRILFDLDGLLRRVRRPDLLPLRAATRESLETYRSGFFTASQALSASILSSALHEHLGEKSHGKARKRFIEANEKEASLSDFRWIAVQQALGKVLDDYNPATGRPERSDFNRHASAHRVKEPQYRQVNALSALMLVTSLLLELDDPSWAERTARKDGIRVSRNPKGDGVGET
ncbi:MAG: hypothetical protein JWO14_2218 [Solirubrobacterales bacterium]|nr:hypothetical protein [Solirubrobacterales bacterium]